MDLAAWHEALRVRVKSLYTTMRALYAQIAAPDTFLVSATRLGGQHGYDEAGASRRWVARWWASPKRISGSARTPSSKRSISNRQRKASEVAEMLIEETLRDPGAVEIGYKDGQRWTVGLQEQPAADGQPGLTLDKDTVFLITGAAGSIVSAITADLAAASGGTFYLLDLVPEPDPNNPDLKRFVSDKEGLKRDLFARIQARGERATPAMVEKELAALERAQAARKRDRRRASSRRHRALFQRQSYGRGRRGQSYRPGARAQRAHRRAAARRRHGAQPLPAGQRPARIRSGLRRQKRRLVQSSACHRRHAAGSDGGLQFDCRSLRQRRTGGLQLRQRPVVQDHLELPHHPAGHARHRHRLDGVGRHRHGHARLHPQNDGAGRHRYAAAGSGHSFDPPRTDRGRNARRDCHRPASRDSTE